MSEVFFTELGIPAPAYHLGVHGGGHGEMTGRMLSSLETVIQESRPAVVIVYGDTNSTLAGALAAAKLQVPVAHVEAGLRSFNRRMPEEINRIVVDRLSDLLFCPTRTAVDHLAHEGITAGVANVGDVMYDATIFAAEIAYKRSVILETLKLTPKSYVLATIHRAGNTDDARSLATLFAYLRRSAQGKTVVFPVHPRTRTAAHAAALDFKGFCVTPPVGYLDMHRLLQDAVAVFTDSGGLQKEAYFHRVPCVTLRSETEWIETIECGWNRLWTEESYRPRMEIKEYGDGHAAEQLVSLLFRRYKGNSDDTHKSECIDRRRAYKI
jgi:UDP-GlcNAc3NAcA epimerase